MAIPYLLNEYARDLLGYRKEIEPEVLSNLVAGLEKIPTAYILLAQDKDRYVGFAICFVGFSTFKAKPLINIHDIGVLKEYRNQGVGILLMEEIEKKAKLLGCCKITLEVQERNNSARVFYKKSGFQESFLDEEAGGQLFLTKEL